jgi:hypothetical protein
MSAPFRHAILFGCTLSTFMVLGRAPGAINLRLRDIETAISSEAKLGRDKKIATRPVGAKSL